MGYGVESLLAVAIVLPLLGILAVALRFYVRLHLKRDFIGIDDWLILLSIILVCEQAAIQILGKCFPFVPIRSSLILLAARQRSQARRRL